MIVDLRKQIAAAKRALRTLAADHASIQAQAAAARKAWTVQRSIEGSRRAAAGAISHVSRFDGPGKLTGHVQSNSLELRRGRPVRSRGVALQDRAV